MVIGSLLAWEAELAYGAVVGSGSMAAGGGLGGFTRISARFSEISDVSPSTGPTGCSAPELRCRSTHEEVLPGCDAPR